MTPHPLRTPEHPSWSEGGERSRGSESWQEAQYEGGGPLSTCWSPTVSQRFKMGNIVLYRAGEPQGESIRGPSLETLQSLDMVSSI